MVTVILLDNMEKKMKKTLGKNIEKNESYITEITDINHEGQGVGRINGMAVFVDGALIGERVEVKLIKVLKNYAIGKIIQIRNTSSDRVEPFCSTYKHCGGCGLQHMSYESQLKFKTNLVRETLKRIGKIEDALIQNTIGMESPFNYRNKVQYPVGLLNGKPVVGYYAKRSHDVVGIESCGIQDFIGNKVREIFERFIRDNNISVYDEIKHRGLIRHLIVRTGFKTKEVMVIVVVNGRFLPGKELFVNSLLNEVPTIKSIVLNINTSKTNVILGNQNIKIYGKDTITDYIGKFKFRISPLSFFQINPVQTEVLYNKALEFAGLTGNETVFDLYCGTGTISLFMAQKARQVYGVEVVEDAVLDARKNAKDNGVENVEFIAGGVEKVIPELYSQGVKAEVVVVDPPRKGCDTSLLDTIVEIGPKRIVYVSCNPSTLARDLMYLEEKGYKAVEVQPVDMFPWTGHVECVIKIQRVK
jgi:23S rRNA (uracil1939-C5)-methyltransferase